MEEDSGPCDVAQLFLAGRERVAICVSRWVVASPSTLRSLTHTEFPETQKSPRAPLIFLCSFLCGDVIMGRWIN